MGDAEPSEITDSRPPSKQPLSPVAPLLGTRDQSKSVVTLDEASSQPANSTSSSKEQVLQVSHWVDSAGQAELAASDGNASEIAESRPTSKQPVITVSRLLEGP